MIVPLLSACGRVLRRLLVPAVLMLLFWLVEPAGLLLAASPAAEAKFVLSSAPLQRSLSPLSFVALLILLAFLVALFYGFLRWLALAATAGRRVQRPVRRPRYEQDKTAG